MKASRLTLREQLLATLVLSVLPLVVLTVLDVSEEYRQSARTLKEHVETLAGTLAASEEDLFRETGQALGALARLALLTAADSQTLQELLREVREELPRYASLGVTDSAGRVLASSPEAVPDQTIGDRSLLREVLRKGSLTATGPVVDPLTGRRVTYFLRPVKGQGGSEVVVFAALDGRWVDELLERFEADLGCSACISVVDGQGNLVNPVGESAREAVRRHLAPLAVTAALSRDSGMVAGGPEGGSRYLYAFRSLTATGTGRELHILIAAPKRTLLRGPRGALALNLAALSGVLLGVILLSWVGTRALILRRVDRLMAATGRIAAGERGVRTGVLPGRHELDRLAAAFDRMVVSLEEQQAHLERSERSARRYAERLDVMHRCEQEILKARSQEQVAATAFSHLSRLVSFPWATLVLLEQERDGMEARVVFSAGSPEPGPGSIVPLELFGDLERARRGEIHVVADAGTASSALPVRRALLAGGLRSYASVPLLPGGKLTGFLNVGFAARGGPSAEETAILRDLALTIALAVQQSRLIQSLRDRQERVTVLARHLTGLEEEERKRFARELHDTVGHELSSLNIDLALLQQGLPAGASGEQRRLVGECLELVSAASQSARSMMGRLRPEVLDDYGLFAALRREAHRLQRRTGAAVTVHGADLRKRLTEEAAIQLFRVAEEALANVEKHAAAARVTVMLEEDDGVVRLTVGDDGRGFDLLEVTRRQGPSSWGLVTMRERMEAIGGTLRVDSAPDRGTAVIAELRR